MPYSFGEWLALCSGWLGAGTVGGLAVTIPAPDSMGWAPVWIAAASHAFSLLVAVAAIRLFVAALPNG